MKSLVLSMRYGALSRMDEGDILRLSGGKLWRVTEVNRTDFTYRVVRYYWWQRLWVWVRS